MEHLTAEEYRKIVDQRTAVRRKNRQLERALQTETLRNLRAMRLAAVVVPVPNSFFIPTRTPEERVLANRLVSQLVRQGFLLPGAADFMLLWDGGSGCIEMKREASRDLFGMKTPKGQLSKSQKTFAEDCADVGVPYAICHNWPEVHAVVTKWRVPRL